jgi:hypothetical protein
MSGIVPAPGIAGPGGAKNTPQLSQVLTSPWRAAASERTKTSARRQHRTIVN